MDNKIIFAPRPECLGVELSPNVTVDGDRIIGELIFSFRMPDPKRCVILENFTMSEALAGDKAGTK